LYLLWIDGRLAPGFATFSNGSSRYAYITFVPMEGAKSGV
jgi:hypothetical protein